MFASNLRCSALARILLFAAVTGILAIVAIRLDAQEQAPPAGKLQELRKERLATIREMSRLILQRYNNNLDSYLELREANRLLLEAELESCESNKDRVSVLEKSLLVAKNVENMADRASKAGQGRASAAMMAKADRLKIEIDLEQTKSKPASSRP